MPLAPQRVTKRFQRAFKKKPPNQQARISKCLRQLREGGPPYHPGLHTHKVQGHPTAWEAYVDGANRVTFERDGEWVVLRNNCKHDMPGQNP
jgi:mRNA-degrading endonuclease YafQ of YafQ-DinJ toxin-antitoxin module